jgi:Heavy metal associated domain 2
MHLTGVARSGGIILLADLVIDLSEKTSMSKMNLKVEHQVPGRVRMKIPAGKGNPELLKQISEVFGDIPGIEEIIVNPTTGSVVLHYDVDRHDEFHGAFREQHATHNTTHGASNGAPPSLMHGADTELDKLTNSIEAEAEFLARHSHTARAVVDFVKKVDQEVKRATNNSVDLKIIFAVGIIGLTVFEVGATAATPVWVTLAIFTVNHFIQIHEQERLVNEGKEPNLAPVRAAG